MQRLSRSSYIHDRACLPYSSQISAERSSQSIARAPQSPFPCPQPAPSPRLTPRLCRIPAGHWDGHQPRCRLYGCGRIWGGSTAGFLAGGGPQQLVHRPPEGGGPAGPDRVGQSWTYTRPGCAARLEGSQRRQQQPGRSGRGGGRCSCQDRRRRCCCKPGREDQCIICYDLPPAASSSATTGRYARTFCLSARRGSIPPAGRPSSRWLS